MSKELGKRISEALKRSNTQQKELAERIGITEAVMSRYIQETENQSRMCWLTSLLP